MPRHTHPFLLWAILFPLLFYCGQGQAAAALPVLGLAVDQSRAQAKTLLNKGRHEEA